MRAEKSADKHREDAPPEGSEKDKAGDQSEYIDQNAGDAKPGNADIEVESGDCPWDKNEQDDADEDVPADLKAIT